MRKRWVVISNCQSFGLANSIQCLAKNVDCTGVDVWQFQRNVREDPNCYCDYDFALLLPEVRHWPDCAEAGLPHHKLIPCFEFPVYHPDSVYVMADGKPLTQGVIGDYHSMIALAAYKEGLDAERAASFFNADIYQSAGYFDQWMPFRNVIVERFRDFDLDIAPAFVRRSRGRVIMHTINHPVIEMLFDMARAILTHLDEPFYADAAPPPDNLATIVWPVYPEIGERLGVAGSYLFKPTGEHKPLELVEFVDRSLAVFRPWDRSRLRVIRNLEPALQRVRRHMREAA